MGKRKRRNVDGEEKAAPSVGVFTAPQAAVEMDLDSLFASSSRPVRIGKVQNLRPLTPAAAVRDSSSNRASAENSNTSGHHLRSVTSEIPPGFGDSDVNAPVEDEHARARKRKRAQDSDKLESSYMNRLARQDPSEEKSRLPHQHHDIDDTDSGANDQAISYRNKRDVGTDTDKVTAVSVHESVVDFNGSVTIEKASRTVFLGNVSTSAIKSKAAKKALLSHLSSFLEELPAEVGPHHIVSLRFRSTAFVSGAGPKRAAYAKKELMDETTKSTHAYAVYSTEIAARRAAMRLNGTVVLERHIRVDYVASPGVIDHKRCVFVGNLGFVDQEAVDDAVAGDNSQRRPRGKEPADIEEGLWRIFNKAGKVQSVRVVRDGDTRVGKGFAYVQFEHENSVETALLYNDKKYPPMLPRKLRVMRAKRMKKSAAGKGNEGRGSRIRVPSSTNLTSRSSRQKTFSAPGKSKGLTHETMKEGLSRPESFVFEGHRATRRIDGQGTRIKASKRHGERPKNRSSRRGAAFKAVGGRRKRAS